MNDKLLKVLLAIIAWASTFALLWLFVLKIVPSSGSNTIVLIVFMMVALFSPMNF